MEFSLSRKIEKTFPKTISMPVELSKMFDFIEKNNFSYFQTDIQFYPMQQAEITDYFNNEDMAEHFGLLGTTGDGSILAIWEDKEIQRFIHLGSDGDNWLILASNPIDFIRVIAIGYDYFGKEEIVNQPKNSRIEKSFQEWVKETFSVEIPKSGQAIVDLESKKLIDWIENE